MNNNIEIYWSDLTEEAQRRIANALINAGQETKKTIKQFDTATIIAFA